MFFYDSASTKEQIFYYQLFTSVVLLAVNLQCFLSTVYILHARIGNIGKIVMMAIITCTVQNGMAWTVFKQHHLLEILCCCH